MLIFGFGWAKPVPINARNFDNPRKGMALTGIAGPISNLILGVANSLLYYPVFIGYLFLPSSFRTVMYCLCLLFQLGALLNFGLMAFNLIPVPPFDGSRFFYYFLPTNWYFKVMKYERTIMIVVLVAFFALSRLGFSPISYVSNGLFSLITKPLYSIALKLAGL